MAQVPSAIQLQLKHAIGLAVGTYTMLGQATVSEFPSKGSEYKVLVTDLANHNDTDAFIKALRADPTLRHFGVEIIRYNAREVLIEYASPKSVADQIREVVAATKHVATAKVRVRTTRLAKGAVLVEASGFDHSTDMLHTFHEVEEKAAFCTSGDYKVEGDCRSKLRSFTFKVKPLEKADLHGHFQRERTALHPKDKEVYEIIECYSPSLVAYTERKNGMVVELGGSYNLDDFMRMVSDLRTSDHHFKVTTRMLPIALLQIIIEYRNYLDALKDLSKPVVDIPWLDDYVLPFGFTCVSGRYYRRSVYRSDTDLLEAMDLFDKTGVVEECGYWYDPKEKSVKVTDDGELKAIKDRVRKRRLEDLNDSLRENKDAVRRAKIEVSEAERRLKRETEFLERTQREIATLKAQEL